MKPMAHMPLPRHVANLSDAAPPGCAVEAQAQGHLEQEKRSAVAVIVKCPAGEDEDAGHTLALFVQNPSGGYDLAVQNRTLIPTLPPELRRDLSVGLGWAPKQPALQFKRGSLIVAMDVTGLTGPNADRMLTFSFNCKDGELWLSGFDEFAVTFRLETALNSYNFLTGKALLSVGTGCAGRADALSHCRYTGRWKQIVGRRPLSLDDVGDGVAFEPKVE